MSPSSIPVATYRLQLTPSFGFAAAAGVVEYLHGLGVSHVYLSPIFEARPGSTHGYDQTDPRRVRAELGGEEAFVKLATAAHALKMGVVVDIVPNHMAAHHTNPWWWAMLRDGAESEAARFFDVDRTRAEGKVVLPVLGRPLKEAVAAGEVAIERTSEDENADRVRVRYFDSFFPVRRGCVTDGRDLLDVLNDQHYTLAYWREARTALNYRRFFDVTELAGVRIEDPYVFDAMHAKLLELVSRGLIDAVRIDHIDGLADPAGYLRRLRACLDKAAPERRIFLLVEKILARDESLPVSWEADGTTGYEFAASAVGLSVDWDGFAILHEDAVRTGAAANSFPDEVVRAKKMIATEILTPELDRVTRLAHEAVTAANRQVPEELLRRAVLALSVELHVYRTYADSDGIGEPDLARLRDAAARAASRDADAADIVQLLVAAIARTPPFDTPTAADAAIRFTLSWQQFTGPLAAKGVEDTAHYRDASLPALNEVGAEPVRWNAAATMRAILGERSAATPFSLNTTATHDTKRGEDTRARLAAFSHDVPTVRALLEETRAALGDRIAPSDLRLLTLTMAALTPDDADPDGPLLDRLKEYMGKATREAKGRTSWVDPDESYARACDGCVDWLGRDAAAKPIRDRMRLLGSRTRNRAAVESLGAVLLKCLAPGVPDFYQGCEFLDLSLVDPDNRRAVDWNARRDEGQRLAEEWASDPAAAAARWLSEITHDRAKFFVTWRALRIRRWLLQGGDRPTLESFDSGPSHREWVTACGDRGCRVQMWNIADPEGIDQLFPDTAFSPTSPPASPLHWPIRVTAWEGGTSALSGLIATGSDDAGERVNAGDRNRTCTGV